MALKVAFLGPEGTYTHQAVEEYFDDYEKVLCCSIAGIVEADADAAVIPFENSIGGGVGESIDLLRQKNVEVTGEQDVEIDHVLASREEEISEIQRVRSHPQALGQCRKFLKSHDWEEIESSSTARAAEKLEENEAAICSELAAELNDLNIIKSEIQDRESNTTRFLVLGDQSKDGEKTSLILEPGEDRPGLLGSMLSCFSGHGVNLSYIQSRPTQNELGEYYFYIEAEEGREHPKFKETVRCLKTYADVEILGTYSKG